MLHDYCFQYFCHVLSVKFFMSPLWLFFILKLSFSLKWFCSLLLTNTNALPVTSGSASALDTIFSILQSLLLASKNLFMPVSLFSHGLQIIDKNSITVKKH